MHVGYFEQTTLIKVLQNTKIQKKNKLFKVSEKLNTKRQEIFEIA